MQMETEPISNRPNEARPPSAWTLIWSSPWGLRLLVLTGVAIAAYEAVYSLSNIAEGSPPTPSLAGHRLPYVPLATAATLLLALGTAALAYAALRQARASDVLISSAAGQASATERLASAAEMQATAAKAQLDVAKLQLGISKDVSEFQKTQTAALVAQAETTEGLRLASTFPQMNVVTTGQGLGGTPIPLIPGNIHAMGMSPTIGVQNFGKGPASRVRISASWKILDFAKAVSATATDIATGPWVPVPEFVRGIERMEPENAVLVESVAWVNGSSNQGFVTKRVVGIYIKVSWDDPDGNREAWLRGGLQLLPGTHRQLHDLPIGVDDFMCLGSGDCPPDDAFSPEDSLSQ